MAILTPLKKTTDRKCLSLAEMMVYILHDNCLLRNVMVVKGQNFKEMMLLIYVTKMLYVSEAGILITIDIMFPWIANVDNQRHLTIIPEVV